MYFLFFNINFRLVRLFVNKNGNFPFKIYIFIYFFFFVISREREQFALNFVPDEFQSYKKLF